MSILLMPGCFNKYLYTAKELNEHFKTKDYTPKYNVVLVDKQPIFVAEAGDTTKPVLLLIHGAPGAWYGYLNLMDDPIIRKNYHVIIADRPGYGKSGYGKPEISMKKQAEQLLRVLAKYNSCDKPAIVLGRSYGAPVAVWMAALSQGLIAKIILVSSVMHPDKEKFFWFSPLGKWSAVKLFLPKALNVATDEKYNHSEEMRKLYPFMGKVICDSYILQGGKDWIADTSNFSYAQKMLVNSRQHSFFLNDNGHLITYERPELIRQILLEN